MNGREVTTPQLPTLEPWMRNLLAGLFALYVVELVLHNAGAPVYALQWRPFGLGFEVWQPLTRFLVQGANVIGVVVGLVILTFVLPPLDRIVDRALLRDATLAGAVGGTVVAMALDPLLASAAPVQGWGGLVAATFVLFGLAMPHGIVRLFFILPVSGAMIVWGTLAVDTLLFLLDPGLPGAERIGVWAGVFAWWHLLGPGGRRRALIRQSRDIERKLARFQVIEGGKDVPQGGQGDDWVH